MKLKIKPLTLTLSRRVRLATVQAKALLRITPGGRFYTDGIGYFFQTPQHHNYHGGPHWCVVKSGFHGGGVLSNHYTREAAKLAADKYRTSDCTCGCARVVRRDRVRRTNES